MIIQSIKDAVNAWLNSGGELDYKQCSECEGTGFVVCAIDPRRSIG